MPSQRRSILCPNCRRLVSVDEPQCPHCGISRPGSRWKNNFWTRGFRDLHTPVKAVIGANVAMYVISLLLGPISGSLNPLTMLSPANKSLLILGATGTFPIDRLGRWWTLISANYLHGGLLHILFNMIAFRQLAGIVVQEYGAYRMLLLYTGGGAFGFWVSYLARVPFTLGASSAVCALIGAALYFGKSRGGSYGQAIYRQVGGWAIGIFIFGLLVPGINNWAHGGGALGGILLGYLVGYEEKRRETVYHKILAGLCAAVTVLVLLWAVVSAVAVRISL